MPETKVVAVVPSKVLVVGGRQHSGWLPADAVVPLDTPTRRVELTIEVQFDGFGYLLCYSSSDGSLQGDTWHESQADAERVAHEAIGVQAHEWERA